MTTLEADYTTDTSLTGAAADYSGDWGGSGGGPPAVTHDYTPFELDANASSLDAVVAALTPHAYLKLNDAAGLPQDSSGNAHHATAISGATYSQAALTTKANAGIRLTGAITLAPPVADPSAGTWSASFLAKWHDFDTAVNANGFPGILSWCGGSPPKYTLSTSFGGAGNGRMSNLFDSQFADIGHTSIAWRALTLEQVYAFVIVTTSDAAVAFSTVFVDAVPWVTGYREGDGVIGTTWDIGQNSGNNAPFFSSADWTLSNYAQYAAALTYANVQTLTEAMHDATTFAAAQVFTT